jgi:Spo0E like sporulation regulatory protein
MVMMLSNLVQLTNKIQKLRTDMIHKAGIKGLSDEQVLKISKDLDKEIIVLQRMLIHHHFL